MAGIVPGEQAKPWLGKGLCALCRSGSARDVGSRARASPPTSPSALQRRSCFPQTEEKVKHLKRKNAELAVIAKRLEERARKLQEANLKVVGARTSPPTPFGT